MTPISAVAETSSIHTTGLQDQAAFVSFLDHQIDWLLRKMTLPGWTKWALLGSIAAACWLLLAALEGSNKPNWIVVIMILITASNLSQFRVHASLVTEREYTFHRHEQRFMLTNKVFAGARSVVILVILEGIVVIALICLVRFQVPTWLTITAVILSLYHVCLGLAAFLLISISFPVPARQPHAGSHLRLWYGTFVSLACVTVIVGYLVYSVANGITTFITDLKVAGLISVVWYLAWLLVVDVQESDNSLITVLVNTRQDLALGSISLDAAIRQVDVALAGLKLSEVLQNEVSAVIRTLDDAQKEVRSASQRIDALVELTQETLNAPTQQNRVVFETLADAIRQNITKANNIISTDFGNANARYHRRLAIVRGVLASDNEVEIDTKITQMRKEIGEECQIQLDKMVKIREELHNRPISGNGSDLNPANSVSSS